MGGFSFIGYTERRLAKGVGPKPRRGPRRETEQGRCARLAAAMRELAVWAEEQGLSAEVQRVVVNLSEDLERKAASPSLVTFADIKLFGGQWCCRWCRAKALRICEIEHQPWCRLCP